MAVWRCPHCATPQPESSRCWVCRRSTTSCLTCRHFRRGVAGGLGVCGLDPRHPALSGSEMRACWVAAAPPPEPGQRERIPVGPGLASAGDPSWRPPRTFVPVEPSAPPAEAAAATVSSTASTSATATATGTTDAAVSRAAAISPATGSRRVPGTWWLWGDPEPWPEG